MALAVIGAVAVALLAYNFLARETQPTDSKPSAFAGRPDSPVETKRQTVDGRRNTSAPQKDEIVTANQGPKSKELLRSNYDRSIELPNGVAFWTVMQKINMWATSKPNLAIAWIRTEMRLSDADASKFLNQLQLTYQSYTAELLKTSEQLACSDAIKHASRDDLYSTLEKLDDLNYELAEKHLTILKGEVGDVVSNRFQVALDNSKLRISHSTVSQDIAHETQARDPLQSIRIICDQLQQIDSGEAG